MNKEEEEEEERTCFDAQLSHSRPAEEAVVSVGDEAAEIAGWCSVVPFLSADAGHKAGLQPLPKLVHGSHLK